MLNAKRMKIKLLARHITLLVLLLTVHSVVVSGFHHHASRQNPSVENGISLEADSTTTGKGSPLGNGDSSCVSCQLQRTFASEIRTPSEVALAPSITVREPLLKLAPARVGPTLVLSDRAPPASLENNIA